MKKLAILLLVISFNACLFSMEDELVEPLKGLPITKPKAKIEKTSSEIILDIVKQKPVETIGGTIAFTVGLYWSLTKLFSSKDSDSECQPWKKLLKELQLTLTAEQWANPDTADILIEAYSGNVEIFLENENFWQDLGPMQKRLVLQTIAEKSKSLSNSAS